MTRKRIPTVANRLWALVCMVFDHRAAVAHSMAQRSHPTCARCGAEMKPTDSR